MEGDRHRSAVAAFSRWRSGVLRAFIFVCGSLYFILTSYSATNWTAWHRSGIDDALLFPADSMAPRKILAVLVPTHAGDINDAMEALSRWPMACSAVTLHRMQLVIYYSRNMKDGVWPEEIIPTIERTAGRCFKRTRVIFADLDEKVTESNPPRWAVWLWDSRRFLSTLSILLPDNCG